MTFPIYGNMESHKIHVPNHQPGTSFFVGGYPTWYPHEIPMSLPCRSPQWVGPLGFSSSKSPWQWGRQVLGAYALSRWPNATAWRERDLKGIWWVQELLLIFWILERCNICCIYSERQGLSENMEYRWIVSFNQFFMAHKWWFTNLPVDWRIDHLQKVANASLNHGWQLQKIWGLSGCLKNLDPIILLSYSLLFFSGLSSLSPWTLPFVGDS